MSMAAATRSPSPGPAARPCCGGLRRSADSSPVRPAPSPSGGVSQRRCVAEKEKENDPRDVRTHKVRSSGSCGGGGGGVAKSFMAPTISAASKAVAPSPSPRKRILGERNNDAVLSSPRDLAHGAKPRGPHPPPPPALGAPRRLRLSLDGAAPSPPAAAQLASDDARHSFGGDEEADNYHHRHRDAASAADAEEVEAAPYDPRTNYLSPRPRFLRYKPNPRVEMYRHSAGGSVRRLEDGFASESSSEEVDTATTTTTEGEVSEEDQEQTTLSSVPADGSTEEETSALSHASVAGTESAAPAVVLSHPAPDSPLARVQTPERKESPRAGGVLTPEKEPAASPARAHPKKKKSPLRFLLAPLALVLFMAAALICVPPPPGSPAMLNTSLSKVSDFLSVQELHPVELAARLKQLSSSSLDLVTSYWEALGSYREQEVFGPHFALNLSAAAVVDIDPVGFYYGATQRSEPIDAAEMEQEAAEMEQEAISLGEMEETVTCAMEETVTGAMEEANESVDAEVEEFGAEMAEEVPGNSGEGTAAFIQNLDIPSPSTPEPEQGEGMDEVSSQHVQTQDSEGDRADGKGDQGEHHDQELRSDMWPGYLDKISNLAAIGAALAAIIVSAVLAFLYMWHKQAPVSSTSNEPVEQAEQAAQAEKAESSGSSKGHAAKGSQFQNPLVEESERLGGSGASQYSSSLSSGPGSRRRKAKVEDTLGLEQGVSRRHSTTRSTSSYGSFTTYEKIHAKKGQKEDEAMTPVRRSSRLRSVKSPEA
ncbi:hypothetical protein U9M48_010147 [Paspalum notatum var. saurae]|uniref:Uncharacterized protein n=1 Tax=Paspalum notatum var. saurae TaxID=547442 RepID=A0AAQ3WFU6_PASNO